MTGPSIGHPPDIWVVGDVMLDVSISGTAQRLSQEGPVPVVLHEAQSARLGGAGNVAHNARTLGAAVTLFGVRGRDAEGHLLGQLGADAGVHTVLVEAEDRLTTTKTRIYADGQHVARVDRENVTRFPPELSQRLVSSLRERPAPRAVVISDYAKGVVDPVLIDAVLSLRPRPMVIVDPKASDLALYADCDFVTPNEGEVAPTLGLPVGQLPDTALRGLVRRLGSGLLVTRGRRGMVLVTRAGEVSHVPARPQRAVDVVGAGDTAVAAFTVQLAIGSSPPAAAQFANDAAGIAVGRPGAHAVPRQELATGPGSERRPSKQVTWVEAQAICRSVQQTGTVVVTNGCFDLLHPGHLHLLREARGHGDLLVVAVNDDASVRRLKGEGRPVMRLEHRMAALAAHDEVDLLVSFSSERELLDLIELLQPDGLVKGADRRPEEIAGRDIVERRGGRIVLVDLFGRWSTTELLTSVVSRRQ